MAYKEFFLTDSLSVTIYKRRRCRSLRLSIAASGRIRMTIPVWVSYRSGLEFARSRLPWIERHYRLPGLLVHGQIIGKAHHLVLQSAANVVKPIGRVGKSEVIVRYPAHISPTHETVQQVAQRAGMRALRLQARQLLPIRLDELAKREGFRYKSVSVRQLKSRWGSCDSESHIVLSIFLMQLPWDLIDYVLLHELVHTNVHKHGPEFWQQLEKLLPNARSLRKTIRSYQPHMALQ
jgi:predicted metal-dependent hydrolase